MWAEDRALSAKSDNSLVTEVLSQSTQKLDDKDSASAKSNSPHLALQTQPTPIPTPIRSTRKPTLPSDHTSDFYETDTDIKKLTGEEQAVHVVLTKLRKAQEKEAEVQAALIVTLKKQCVE